jgi:hypothetical protein
MDWQLCLVIVCLALSALYLARQMWRSLSGRKGCGGCGCAKGPDDAAKPAATSSRIIPVEELTLRTKPRS